MQDPDLIGLFVKPLKTLGARYIVSGSIASMLYGEPRVTHDIDVVAFLRADDVLKLSKIYPSPEFYVPPSEAIYHQLTRSRGSFNIIHVDSALKADIYLAGRDEFHGWAFRNAREYEAFSERIRLAPPEYVIVRKLEFYREGGSEKHLRDIRAMLAVSGDQIDQSELNEWIRRQGVQEEWRKVS